jgi:hypothetical protein
VTPDGTLATPSYGRRRARLAARQQQHVALPQPPPAPRPEPLPVALTPRLEAMRTELAGLLAILAVPGAALLPPARGYLSRVRHLRAELGPAALSSPVPETPVGAPLAAESEPPGSDARPPASAALAAPLWPADALPGERVRACRVMLRWSRVDVAAVLGVPESKARDWEEGRQMAPADVLAWLDRLAGVCRDAPAGA